MTSWTSVKVRLNRRNKSNCVWWCDYHSSSTSRINDPLMTALERSNRVISRQYSSLTASHKHRRSGMLVRPISTAPTETEPQIETPTNYLELERIGHMYQNISVDYYRHELLEYHWHSDERWAFNTFTSTISLQTINFNQYGFNSLTSTLSLQLSHFNSLTSNFKSLTSTL